MFFPSSVIIRQLEVTQSLAPIPVPRNVPPVSIGVLSERNGSLRVQRRGLFWGGQLDSGEKDSDLVAACRSE